MTALQSLLIVSGIGHVEHTGVSKKLRGGVKCGQKASGRAGDGSALNRSRSPFRPVSMAFSTGLGEGGGGQAGEAWEPRDSWVMTGWTDQGKLIHLSVSFQQ